MSHGKPIQFLMVGGFLGAGKTTTIARLAQHFVDTGKKVGLVTNDQAYDLVDTMSLRAQGFDVGEVPGACFCCKFDDLISTVESLCEEERPDILIAEPVGSCTDLVATVLEPMRGLYGDEFQPGRFAVLLKPEHGLRILRRDQVGFSEQAAYIFRKQLEEADIIVINKIDKLDVATIAEISALIENEFPGKPCRQFSAKSGAGFDELLDEIQKPATKTSSFMEVDYDVYAEGEAELGWLNATVRLTVAASVSLDDLAQIVVHRIQDELQTHDVEVAHLKVLASDGDSNAAIANLVSTENGVDLSVSTPAKATQIELTVNARVATGPNALESFVRTALRHVASDHAAELDYVRMQKLSPGRPVPTHRMTS